MLRALSIAMFCWASAAAAGAAPQEETWRLYRGLQGAKRLEIVAAEGPARDAAQDAAALVSTAGPLEVVLLAPGEKGDSTAVRVVLGTKEDRLAREIAYLLQLTLLEGGGFGYLGRVFAGSGDVFLATLEDPRRKGLPLTLVFANDARVFAAYAALSLGRHEPRAEVYADGECALSVPLRAQGRALQELAIDFAARRAARQSRLAQVDLPGFSISTSDSPPPERLIAYVKAAARVRSTVLSLVGAPASTRVVLNLHGSPAAMAELTGRTELSFVNPVNGSVHALLAPNVPDDGAASVARTVVRQALGPAAERWMEDGMAVAAAGTWWNRSLAEWGAWLSAAGEVPPLAEILHPSAESRFSPHVLAPLRGVLFQCLVTEQARRVRAYWTGTEAFQVSAELEGAFMSALKAGKPAITLGARRERDARRAQLVKKGHLLGVGLDLSSFEGNDELFAPELEASLAEARAQGANAVEIVVFAANDPSRNSLYGNRPFLDSQPSDLALAHAFAVARRLGLGSLLIVEPLESGTGTRADEEVLLDPRAHGEFFERFGATALHYGLLGELLSLDALCVGIELTKASATLGEDGNAPTGLAARSLERWKELIQRLRPVFAGALVYAADLEREARQIGFFDALDFVGVDFFPALAGGERPNDLAARRAIGERMRRAFTLAERLEKRILFVQLGFPSSRAGWDRGAAGRGEVDLAEQSRVLGFISDALNERRAQDDLLAGLFLWGHPVRPLAEPLNDSGYSTRGKPAYALLSRLFGVER